MTANAKAFLIVAILTLIMASCSSAEAAIYRVGNSYSDQPGGVEVKITDNTSVAEVIPYEPPRRHRHRRASPAVVVQIHPVVNVTVERPAPLPVYVSPPRNYLAAPGWRNPRYDFRNY